VRISLHHLTLTETTPIEFADIAAASGCNHVCLFIKVPGDSPMNFPRIESVRQAHEFKRHLEGLGLSVWNTDTFMIQPGTRLADYRETLEIAAALGAKTINALDLLPDRNAAVDLLGSFSALAGEHGITALLEWYRYAKTNTLEDAVKLIRDTGQTNLQLNTDILHLIRNGNKPEDLAAVDPALLQYAQINDGPLVQPDDKQFTESVSERNFPGEEEFPSVSFIQHLPTQAVISIEAPVNRLRGSLTPLQRAQRAVAGTRRLLSAAGR
jgi:sugar phosphate isomerase/epimerase